MNGPQRLFESEGGRLAEALGQARARLPEGPRLAQIAKGLAAHGIAVEPHLDPGASAGHSGWSLGTKLMLGVGGVVAAAALVTALSQRSASTGGVPSAPVRAILSVTQPGTSPEAYQAAPGIERPRSGTRAGSEAPPLEGSGSQSAPVAGGANAPAPEVELPVPARDPSPEPAGLAAPDPMRQPSGARSQSSRALAPEASEATASEATAPQARSKATATPETKTFVSPSGAADAESEIELLQRARGLLATSPAGALSLTEQHRSTYPRGNLAQEREVIAITALARLGRRSEAEQRAARFRSAYPRSAYLKQIDRVLGSE